MKGFTLIELLAVIVILAIIMAIGIASIGGIISNSRINALKSSNKLVASATKLYLSQNEALLPTNYLGKIEIPISDIIAAGLLKTISSPFNSQNCSGYVTIVNIGNNAFDISPTLDCFNQISSSADDGLLMHYTFNNFAETTRNIVLNPDGNTLTSSVPGAVTRSWDNSLHSDSIVPSQWSSGHNAGVASETIGYHAKWIYEGTNPVMYFKDQNDVFGLGHRWLGISQSLGLPQDKGIKHGDSITISWLQKSTSTSKGAAVGLYHTRISTATMAFDSNIAQVNSTKTNEWERVSFTTTVDTDWNLAAAFSIYVYGSWGAYGELWVDDVQVEIKGHTTPFVVGDRIDTVNDSSTYNRTGAMTLTKAPKWVSNGLNGSGAYKFNGINQVINSNLNKVSNTYTLSLWAKREGNFRGGVDFVSLAGFRYITEQLQGITYFADYNIGYKEYNGTPGFLNSGVNIDLNKWYNIVLTYESGEAKIYVDGELKRTSSMTLSSNNSSEFQIGAITWDETLNRAFEGIIDEVRVYNRTLNDKEIKILYNLYKN